MSSSSSSLVIQPSIVQKVGLTKFVNRATNKANEYLRLIHAKCPPYGELPTPQANMAKVMICVELACLFHDLPYNKTELVKLSGTMPQDYVSSLNLVRNILGIKPQVQFSALCKEFGCPGLTGPAEKCLEMYRRKLMEKNSAASVKTNRVIDFSAPVYKAVAFYVTAKHLKFKVDKNKLMEVTNCTVVQFTNVVSSMTESVDLQELVITDSMQDIRERIIEQRKKKIEKKEKKNHVAEEQTEEEKSALIGARLTEMMKKNRYLEGKVSSDAVEKFIQPKPLAVTDSTAADNDDASTTTTTVRKTKANVCDDDKQSTADKTRQTTTTTSTGSNSLKRARPTNASSPQPKPKKLKQLVLNFSGLTAPE